MLEFDAVVLAGGTGERLGGVDKAALRVAGRTLLDGVLLACAQARRTVVVGPARATVVPVTWTLEKPLGGGPLAGLAAGMVTLEEPAPAVVVLATDLARVQPDDVGRLLAALTPGFDAVLFADDERLQPLAGAYRSVPLRRALRDLEPLTGRPMRALLDRLAVHAVPDDGAARDVDTPEDLDRERAEREQGR